MCVCVCVCVSVSVSVSVCVCVCVCIKWPFYECKHSITCNILLYPLEWTGPVWWAPIVDWGYDWILGRVAANHTHTHLVSNEHTWSQQLTLSICLYIYKCNI